MKVSDKYYDEIFDFLGQWDMPSKCGLKIIEHQGKKIIVVTELYQDNPGTSVTYAGGSLAGQICDKKGFSKNEIIYIECNPDTHSKLSFYNEEFFEVSFEIIDNTFVNPTYKQLTPKNIKDYFPEN
ncbi:MAG: hypothetical protein PHC83_00615 [Bacteroidales bacterium]|nr:hypothetical protein [Bacteroidales bacterium]MDD4210308.1 hypothetical protein [Bacteroidales bacterium]